MYATDVVSLIDELVHSPMQEFNGILRRRTVWFGRIINYFKPKYGLDVHSIVHKIEELINKNPSVLKQAEFIINAIKLTNVLEDHVYALIESNSTPELERLFSLVFSLEGCILTHISNNQIENLELVQSIKSRLLSDNVIYYLSGTSFTQNIVLATACCSYIEENGSVEIRTLKRYLTRQPTKAIHLLSAACLAKNDFVIKAVWEFIYSSRNFEIFKADKQLTSTLDYLIDKKEFSNQTLLVGDLQDPKEIAISKEILAQRNPYFYQLFEENFSERSQSTIMLKDMDCTGKLESIDYEGFLCLLRYIYTGKVDVSPDLYPTVSHLANMYLEFDLKNTCDQIVSA